MDKRGALLGRFVVAGAAGGAIAACGSTAPEARSGGPSDATADDRGAAGLDADAAATPSDAGSDAAPLDAAVVIFPCGVGSAFLTCESAGSTCFCTSDLPYCSECDDAGCWNVCGDASCVDRCGPDQFAMACGGNPPPPPPGADTYPVPYIYAGPPDACSPAPFALSTETTFFCCPRALVDP